MLLSAPTRRLLSVAVAALTAATVTTALAGPAAAESRVSITDESGAEVAEVTAGGVMTLSGTGFQSVAGGTGGIYVTFGWVDDPAGGTWAPSQGGSTGEDYLYAPDIEGEGNQGFQRFVAFPGSGTAAAANGGEIAADGTWSTQLAVPQQQFEALDRAGNPAAVDCVQVQCGIITVGAHGVKNANNETFTPVTFVAADSAEEAAAQTAAAEQAAAEEAAAAATAEPEPSAEPSAVGAETTAEVAPPAAADDSSAQRTFLLSLAGGLLAIAVLVVVGLRRARARAAAAAQAEPAPTDDPR